MDFFYYFILFVAIVVVTIFRIYFLKKTVVYENQRGLYYRQGKFVRILNPGAHWLFGMSQSVRMVDIRQNYVTLAGQEVLTSDNITIKISLAAGYEIADPYLAVHKAINYNEALYLALQVNLRDAVGSLTVEELLAKRAAIGELVFEKTTKKAAEFGLKLLMVSLKDVMFPGELKTIFSQVVSARQQGLAALEKARGETAALRSLANASHLFESNPNLLQMRYLQMLEGKVGGSFIVIPPELAGVLKSPGKEKTGS
jgi:regulator of protease activity HflC (stomatin/prohibitin superfamily)